MYVLVRGHAMAQFIDALYYKLEFRGFDSRWSHWNFSLPQPQPLTEMNARVKVAGV
jgi:hypothetical protein